MNESKEGLWYEFMKGLNQNGFNFPLETFKIDNGLRVADWQEVNYTGISNEPTGKIYTDRLYQLCDTMPDFDSFSYLPRNSFYNQYFSFVNSIAKNPDFDDYTLKKGKADLFTDTMEDDKGKSMPSYDINPSLDTFFKACLLSDPNSPEIKFDISYKTAVQQQRLARRAPLVAPLPDFIKANNLTSPINEKTSNNNSNLIVKIPRSLELQNLAKKQAVEVAIPSNEVDLTFEFIAQKAQIFNINIGSWYNSSMITNYYDQVSPHSPLANKDLFGANGILNTRILSVLVLYKRSVNIKGKNTSMLSKIVDPSHLSDPSNSIDIGGFKFSGGSGTSVNENNGTYTYKDNSNAPHIMGFQFEKVGM